MCLETPDCPPTRLSAPAATTPGTLPIYRVEVFLHDDASEDVGRPSVLAEQWLQKVGGPIIPFDMDERRKLVRENCPELIPMILRHNPKFFDE
jgi:hypothetical protein